MLDRYQLNKGQSCWDIVSLEIGQFINLDIRDLVHAPHAVTQTLSIPHLFPFSLIIPIVPDLLCLFISMIPGRRSKEDAISK
jgi:hypothetical protein